MNISHKSTLIETLKEFDVSLKKSLGQNFLIDENIPIKIASSQEGLADGIIEIGPGAGVLTKELALRFKKVVSIELDKRLKPVLDKTLEEHKNVEIIYEDVLKADLKKIIENMGVEKVAVAANLPYYITSPVIMALLEQRLPLESITVMVQKEAADRLTAKIPSRNVGAVTLAVAYFSEPEFLFNVKRGSFMPPPNVDSAVIKLNIRKEPPVVLNSEKAFFKLIKAAFMHRRKTLVNSVASGLGIKKEDIIKALLSLNISETIRPEQLSLEQFANLSNILGWWIWKVFMRVRF